MSLFVKVSSDKWMLNEKTGLYGTRKVKVSKLICVAKNGGLESPSKSTPTRNRVTKTNLVVNARARISSQVRAFTPRARASLHGSL